MDTCSRDVVDDPPQLSAHEDAEKERSLTQPKWFSPLAFTLLMTFLLFSVYLDRGAFSSTAVNGTGRSEENPMGSGIQGRYDLSNFEDGLLSSVFMVGMLVASPVFSEIVHRVNAMRVVGIGMAVWMLAVLGSGLSWNYASLTVFRAFVGFGEAAIVSLSPPFIDDHAPPERKGLWLSLLYSAIPLGMGAGYCLGGVVGRMWSWRHVFVIESAMMLPFVLFLLFAKPVDLKKAKSGAHPYQDGSIIGQFFDHIGIVLSHPVYIISLAAYTIYTGIVGLVAYWGPKAAKAMFRIESADVFMGITSGITGISGTIIGGLLLDRIGSTIPRALSLSFASTMGAVFFLVPSFLCAKSIWWFAPPFSITAILLFLVQAPVNAVFLWSVPLEQRPLAASISVVAIHLFGDVPSPAAYGALLDSIKKIVTDEGQAYRTTMVIVGAFLFVAAIITFVAAIVSRGAVDYRKVEAANQADNEEGTIGEGEQDSLLPSHPIDASCIL